MSGGIAYVYDAENTFSDYCNRELVEFDPMEDEDKIMLKELIGNHYEFTGSTVAKDLLEDWNATLGKFVKVMPRDYKKVLQAKKKKLEEAI